MEKWLFHNIKKRKQLIFFAAFFDELRQCV